MQKNTHLEYPSFDLDSVQRQLSGNYDPEDDNGFPHSQQDESTNAVKNTEIPHSRRAFIFIGGWMVCSCFLDMLLYELDESKFIDGSVVRIEDVFENFEYWKGLSGEEREAVGYCVEFLIKHNWFLNKKSDDAIYRLAY